MKKAVCPGVVFVLLAIYGLTVRAAEISAFHPALSSAEGRPGDTIELSVPYDGSLGELGVFFVRVDYDPELFHYQRVDRSSVMREAYSFTEEREDWVGSGYIMGRQSGLLREEGETFTYRFRVSEDAESGDADFRVTVFEVYSPDANALPSAEFSLAYTVLPPAGQEASLLSLQPDSGVLEPTFSTDQYDYEMTVPFEVTSVNFTAEPVEGATYRVNRKNLGAGGSDTEFLITVTAEDGETKTVYRVMVHRAERETSPKPTATPRPTGTPRPTPTPKPTATPRPTNTPRPTATPKAVSVAGAADSSPSPTTEPTPSPEPSLPPVQRAVTVTPTPEPESAVPAESGPTLEVRTGESSDTLFFWGFVFLGAVFVLSGPLSRLIVGSFSKQGKEAGKKTDDN